MVVGKLIATIALNLICLAAYSARPVDKNATKETKALYRNMLSLASKGFMFGHQDATLYGIGWKYDANRSDCKSVCGDYPAVYGWELGDIELGTKDISLDSIHFDKIREHIIAAYSRGGVNTISWHCNNPVDGKSSWSREPMGAVGSLLPNGANHEKFKLWLDRVADFLQSLRGSRGEAVPIIFRAWHEHSGTWFWWGSTQCTPDQYKELYRFTVSYLRDNKHVHNVLWGYSPDVVDSKEGYFERFPGYEWVDVMAADLYHRKESREEYVAKVHRQLDYFVMDARRHSKIIAISEMGSGALPDAQWWTKVMLPALTKHPVSYGMVWRNAYNLENHLFCPYPGQRSADDFKIFTADKRIFTENKLPKMYR